MAICQSKKSHSANHLSDCVMAFLKSEVNLLDLFHAVPLHFPHLSPQHTTGLLFKAI